MNGNLRIHEGEKVQEKNKKRKKEEVRLDVLIKLFVATTKSHEVPSNASKGILSDDDGQC